MQLLLCTYPVADILCSCNLLKAHLLTLIISSSTEDQKQVELFHKAVNSGGSRQLIVMQATLRGNARSGKTSFLNVIQGKEANTVEPSTGVICKPARIELSRSVVLVDGMDWTPVADLEEEAVLLVQDMTIEQETPDVSVKDAARGASAVTMSGVLSQRPRPDVPVTASQTDSSRLVISYL